MATCKICGRKDNLTQVPTLNGTQLDARGNRCETVCTTCAKGPCLGCHSVMATHDPETVIVPGGRLHVRQDPSHLARLPSEFWTALRRPQKKAIPAAPRLRAVPNDTTVAP